MGLIHLTDRTIHVDGIEEVFWSWYDSKLIGCHIYFKSGRSLDLKRIEAHMVYNYYRNAGKVTESMPIVTGSLKDSMS